MMDTRKIMEALATIERALQMSRLNNECRGEYYDGWCSQALPLVDQIRAELDKAQQPVKVLTDEEVEQIALKAVPLDTTYEDVRLAGQSIEESAPEAIRVYVRGALRYAMGNGYLAPAAGLTDEEIERISKSIAMPHCIGVAKEALRYARDNGYLAPAAGLTDEEAYNVWRSFHFRHQNDGEQYMDYLEARNAAYRARLTAAINAKAK